MTGDTITSTIIDPRVARVAIHIRIALLNSGIGYSWYEDRINAGNHSLYIDIEELAKAALEGMCQTDR